MTDKYYELQDETKSTFTEVVGTLAFPVKINFKLSYSRSILHISIAPRLIQFMR